MSDEYSALQSPGAGYSGSQQPGGLYAQKAAGAPPQATHQQTTVVGPGGKAKTPPRVLVHPKSRLTAARLIVMVKRSKKFPNFLKGDLRSQGAFLTMPETFTQPRDAIASFLAPLHSAFLADSWQLSTASSTIDVTLKDGLPVFEQRVTPDLHNDEELGQRVRVGANETMFSADAPLRSDEREVIYGWTIPPSSTQELKSKRALVVIVNRISVTNPQRQARVFIPDEDAILSSMLHELAVHAGRIVMGLDDSHKNPTVDELAREIGGYFSKSRPSGDLCPHTTTTEIWKYLKLATGPPEGCP
jgi:hypothetical protein